MPGPADKPDDTAEPRAIAGSAARILFGAAIATQSAAVVVQLLGYGSARPVLFEALVTATMFGAAAGTLLSGIAARPGRPSLPWLLLGAGLLSYAFGQAWFFFVQKTITTFPTPADAFWLAAYPCVFAAIALLVREQHEDRRLGISFDAAIVAVAVAALTHELVMDRFVPVDHASSAFGAQLFAYSVLDLGVAIVLGLAALQSRGRVGGAYVAMSLGAVVLLATEFFHARVLVHGTYEPGTILDAGWSAGMLLFGLSCRFGSSLRQASALRGRALYLMSVAAFAVAFGLLLLAALGGRSEDPGVIGFAVLLPFLILVRLVASVQENDRLARDNRGMISAAGEGILRQDLQGRIVYANPAALEMLGYSSREALGRDAHRLFHHTRPNGIPYPASECPSRQSFGRGATQRVTDEVFWRKDGSAIPVHYTVAPLREEGRIVGAVTVFDDVTHQRELKERLRHQADHDSLTGLFNRRRFEEELSSQLRYARRYSRSGVLVLMDLDSFKLVNDSFGHRAGDKLLCEIGAVLLGKVRQTDVVARIGGDEFAILLREASEADAVELAKGAIAAIRAVSDPTIGASAGIAAFDGSGERTPDELLVAADVALYQAKEAGGGTAVVYAGRNGNSLTWVERVRSALAEDRLVVHLQPIADLATGDVVREELLVRMLGEEGETILPAAFLPAAERFGLIQEVDLLVLGKAIELARLGNPVAVNVSGLSLADRRYLGLLEASVRTGGLDPSLLDFEITETAAVANMGDAQDFARRLRDLGCSLSLDDFGTGFSSFTYLKHIPAQHLKIDAEFIHDVKRDPADQRLVAAIVAIARGLGQKTVAEGVEDGETLAVVRELGVDYAQGFYVGRPATSTTQPAWSGSRGWKPTRRASGSSRASSPSVIPRCSEQTTSGLSRAEPR
jgi:diguanylate cyclase (GGDEF)-like protein/PAS domain S-box-containing protein